MGPLSNFMGGLGQLQGFVDMMIVRPIFRPTLSSSILAQTFQGKCVLVTGSNRGIGKEIAVYFAARGADVYLICRSEAKAVEARDDIRARTNNQNVFVEVVDMSGLGSVRAFVERWAQRSPDERIIDFLFNNAGLATSTKVTTDDGMELTYAANFLSQFLLTISLLNLDCFAPNARIVQTSSNGLYGSGKLDPSDPNSSDLLGKIDEGAEMPAASNVMLYARSKAMQAVWTRELQQRLTASESQREIVVQSCHPGWVSTGLWTSPTGFGGEGKAYEAFGSINKVIGITPAQGAVMPIYVATSPETAKPAARGQYWDVRQKWPPGWFGDKQLRRDLWTRWEQDSGVTATF